MILKMVFAVELTQVVRTRPALIAEIIVASITHVWFNCIINGFKYKKSLLTLLRKLGRSSELNISSLNNKLGRTFQKGRRYFQLCVS